METLSAIPISKTVSCATSSGCSATTPTGVSTTPSSSKYESVVDEISEMFDKTLTKEEKTKIYVKGKKKLAKPEKFKIYNGLSGFLTDQEKIEEVFYCGGRFQNRDRICIACNNIISVPKEITDNFCPHCQSIRQFLFINSKTVYEGKGMVFNAETFGELGEEEPPTIIKHHRRRIIECHYSRHELIPTPRRTFNLLTVDDMESIITVQFPLMDMDSTYKFLGRLGLYSMEMYPLVMIKLIDALD